MYVASHTGAVIGALVVEPDRIMATVLARSAAGAGIRVQTLSTTSLVQVLANAERLGAQVLVAGPGYDLAELHQAIPQLMKHGTRTLVVSATALDDRSSMLLLAGASGFLLIEDASMAAVNEAVRTVAAGESALHPTVVQAVLERWRAGRGVSPAAPPPETQPVPQRPAPGLTARERDVLAGLRDGLTTRQLAARLGVAAKTVEAHRSRLYAKLGAKNQAHAVSIASQLELL